MYKIDFSHPGKAHFIGIGGISMSDGIQVQPMRFSRT